MRTLPLLIFSLAVVALSASWVLADQYYVIRDRDGRVAVSDSLPSYGWSIDKGPFATMDEAERAMGTGYLAYQAPIFPRTESMARVGEEKFFVIRNREGQQAISAGQPVGYGWAIDEGPFATKDEAERALASGRLAYGAPIYTESTPVTPSAENFFVVRNREGQQTVVAGQPGYGWTIDEGPFATKDEAERAMGTGAFAYQMPIAPSQPSGVAATERAGAVAAAPSVVPSPAGGGAFAGISGMFAEVE